ncbi:MAG: SRPBCC family protein [Gammaproteobacteria bacterium]
MRQLGVWLLAGLLAGGPACAGEVLSSHVDYTDDHYLIDIDMRIDANADKVFARLQDYNHLHRINSAIKSSRLLKTDGRIKRVRIVTRGCVWFYCRRVEQVQNIEEIRDRYLVATIDPKVSDFKYGRVIWHVWHDDTGTRIRFSADLVPDFWIPPLIGPWVMKKKLLEEGRQTITGLERLDRQ